MMAKVNGLWEPHKGVILQSAAGVPNGVLREEVASKADVAAKCS